MTRRVVLLKQARRDYAGRRSLYEKFAAKLEGILSDGIGRAGIKVHSIDHRTKEVESFVRKLKVETMGCSAKNEFIRRRARIADLAGLRVITYLPSDVPAVGKVVEREFKVLKRADVGAEDSSRLGYRSVHYDIRLKDSRTRLLEYRVFEGLKAEVQVRTILQHAWAEIEHDMVYKSEKTPPSGAVRRFATLSGLLELADREFQSVHDAGLSSHRGGRRARGH